MTRALILARLVGPDAFGLVAAVLPFTSAVAVVAELGLGSYVIYRSDRARSEVPDLTYLAVLTGVSGTAIVAVAAEPLALFYGRPEVMSLALAMSPLVVMTVLTAVPVALLRAEMKLKQAGIAQVIAETAALAVGVSMAVATRSASAVVASYLVSSAVALVGTWMVSGVGIPRIRSLIAASWRAASRYGIAIVAGSMLWLVVLQADNVIVGRLLGATDLGRYALAFNFGVLPGTLIGSIIGQVAFPTFSTMRSHVPRLRQEFASLTQIGATVILPAVAVALADARPAIAWLLGARWQSAVEPLQVFLLVGAIRGIFPSAELLRSLGRIWVEPALAIVTAPLVVAAAVLGAGRGIQTVALCVGGVLVLNEMAGAYVAARSAQIPLIAIVMPLRTALPAAGLGLAAWMTAVMVPLGPGFKTVLTGLVGLGLYAFLVAHKWLPGYQEIQALLKLRPEGR